ncbi:MAG: hypothetical protein HUU20_13230 [Pirellulales bacterium]|nr:hypothetical protein [Pirellulales bacterium]
MKTISAPLLVVASVAFLFPPSADAACPTSCGAAAFGCKDSQGAPVELTASRKKTQNPWERLGSGTRKFFGDVKNLFVAEKSDSKKKSTTYYPSGSNAKQRKKKEGWFASLFRAQEPEKPKTVNDFLKQGRP